MIVVIDYGMGNLRSVAKALEHLGASPEVTSDPDRVSQAEKIVLPGVGAFDHAVKELKSSGLFDAVAAAVRSGRTYLGLCLGLQLLFKTSSEGKEEGFGILPGRVVQFSNQMKVPHMGWNEVELERKDCPLWKGLQDKSYFYFVHSYYAEPEPCALAAKTFYGAGAPFASALWKQNIYATQFHPEKSQENGLRVLENFLKL